jgi:hypothetical protein
MAIETIMESIESEIQDQKKKDFSYNWVTSSRFLFYVQLFCMLAFILGGCYKLYNQGYKGKPEVEIPENTLYTPKYK